MRHALPTIPALPRSNRNCLLPTPAGYSVGRLTVYGRSSSLTGRFDHPPPPPASSCWGQHAVCPVCTRTTLLFWVGWSGPHGDIVGRHATYLCAYHPKFAQPEMNTDLQTFWITLPSITTLFYHSMDNPAMTIRSSTFYCQFHDCSTHAARDWMGWDCTAAVRCRAHHLHALRTTHTPLQHTTHTPYHTTHWATLPTISAPTTHTTACLTHCHLLPSDAGSFPTPLFIMPYHCSRSTY